MNFKENKTPDFFIKKTYSNPYLKKVRYAFTPRPFKNTAVTLSSKQDVSELKFNVFYPFIIEDNIDFFTLELSPFYTYDSPDKVPVLYREFHSAHPVTRFLRESIENGTYVSTDETLLRFVKKHAFITYLIAAKDVVIYKPLEDLFELYAVDGFSGERFYIRRDIP